MSDNNKGQNAPIGVLGGTFDPIHNGHLRLAMELINTLNLDHIRFVPNGKPPHRGAPSATPGQRAKWIRVAISKEPALQLDNRELLRQGPSFMVDTLADMQKDFGKQPLCLVMGRDVFAKLPSWHAWQELFSLCHIILINRPAMDEPIAPQAKAELDKRLTQNKSDLHNSRAGHIYSYAPPPLAISATRIRQLIAAGKSPRYLLPDSTLADILDSGIYRPNE